MLDETSTMRFSTAEPTDRGFRAVRLDAIKRLVLDNLGEPDLTVGKAAAAQRVTPRYVQMLFEAEGTTFSAFVLGRRLAFAHRMFSDPRLAKRAIGAVALDAGFGDLSYFNRAFRRAYGETPSDLRNRTLCEARK
ncbi:helix-turn-helix transcriptional regulator [Phreatobacter stygius]|uniref:Helix-turn-helix transcriptional regulator n=1 Tax=Phreatobacter stygius TaxID=1940610 RepID=A0A4D7B8H8_9HYPH|nr:helix-turn-helix transcriptional regulator [Phreatobacter stygius]QCI67153.1 helix-turn-helix transcriptional regulator [Phreatobacter stygius]